VNFGGGTPLTKDDKGVWTGTTRPLDPGFHYYWFIIDGVRVADPSSDSFFGSSHMWSGIEVPEEGVDFYNPKDVPHGEVRVRPYFSKITNAWRRSFIYTPPGYDQNPEQRYPVLYLQHGAGEDETGWYAQGRVNFIMDNLIAEKKARPMVVVMPVARGGGSLGLGPSGMSPGIKAAGNVIPGAGRGGGPGAAAAGAPAAPPAPATLQPFAQDFLGDLMPLVEKTFRVSTRPDDRAIAGLSAGGAATVNTAFSRPELFKYVVIMSAGAGQNVEASYPKFFANSAAAAKQWKLLWLGVGEADFALNGTKALDEVLNKHGVKHPLTIRPGYRHEWRLWRLDLWEFAPLLFQDGNKGTQ
jgi:enterochelin esterase-like enzyme